MCIITIMVFKLNSIMPCKLGRLSGKHGSMSDMQFQPFSANASEGERAERCFSVFENLVFWYMVLKFLLKDCMIWLSKVSALTDQHPPIDTSDFLHWSDCISTDWFFPSCPTVWLGLCDRILFVNPLSFLHLFWFFLFFFFLLLPMAALVNSALSVTPFSSDSLAFEKMAVCVLTCCSCCWCESKLLQNSWHSQVHWLLWLVSVSIPFSVIEGEGRKIILIHGGVLVGMWEKLLAQNVTTKYTT